MKKIAFIAVEVILVLLAMVQLVRIIGRDSNDRAIGLVLFLIFAAMFVAVLKWSKKK